MTDTYTPVLTDAKIGAIVCDVYKKTGAAEIGELRLESHAIAIGRKIERAAIEAYQRQQWRTIETAPHNEEVLLGWRDWDGAWAEEVSMASWGWRNERVSNISKHGRATHWQPKPLPPEES